MYIKFVLASCVLYISKLDTQQRLKRLYFQVLSNYKDSPVIKWTNTEKLQHLFPHVHFQTVPCFPCELSSLILSVIYKWIFSLVHMGVPLSGVFQAPFPVSSSVLSTSAMSPLAKTEQIALSLSLLKARCHFWSQLPTDTAEIEAILCLWKQMIWKWKGGNRKREAEEENKEEHLSHMGVMRSEMDVSIS